MKKFTFIVVAFMLTITALQADTFEESTQIAFQELISGQTGCEVTKETDTGVISFNLIPVKLSSTFYFMEITEELDNEQKREIQLLNINQRMRLLYKMSTAQMDGLSWDIDVELMTLNGLDFKINARKNDATDIAFEVRNHCKSY